jgi:hypothetical protein
MSSTDGLEAEFNDPRRKELLQALKKVIPAVTIGRTAWACLWLSDIDMLEDITALAQARPIFAQATLVAVELVARIVPICKLINLVLFDC